MAKAKLNSELILQILDLVVPTLYAEGLPEEELKIWQEVDKKYENAELNTENSKSAIDELSKVIPNFPEIDIEEPEQEALIEEVEQQENEQVSLDEFEHQVLEEEDEYKVAVFTPERAYFADSSIVPQKEWYCRKATDAEQNATQPIVSDEDRSEMIKMWGVERFIKFDDVDTYKWSDTFDETSIKVRVKTGLIFYKGAQLGTVENEQPVLTNTGVALKFFRSQTINIQDAKVEGQDLAIIERTKLQNLMMRANNLELKLLNLAVGLGLNAEESCDELAQKARLAIDLKDEKIFKLNDDIARSRDEISKLHGELRELRSKPVVETSIKPAYQKEVVDLEPTPIYIAFYKGKDGKRRYLMQKQVKNKIVAKATTSFEKAAKLERGKLLKLVIEITGKHKIAFTIAKLKIEIQ